MALRARSRVSIAPQKRPNFSPKGGYGLDFYHSSPVEGKLNESRGIEC
jgi:hypothetical protein